MIEILKHGTSREMIKFICEECGCEFLANCEDYYRILLEDKTWGNKCPECGKVAKITRP